MRLNPLLLAASLVLLALSPLARAEQQEELVLIAGMGLVYDLHFTPCSASNECVRISNKALLEIQYSPEKHQLIFTPMRAGETNVIVRDEKGDVALTFDVLVVTYNYRRVADELSALLKDVPGVSVKPFGDHVVVDGQVSEPAHFRRVMMVISRPGPREVVDNLVILSKEAMDRAAKEIQTEIGRPEIKVKAWNMAFILEGHAKDAAEARMALDLAHKLAAALGLVKMADGGDPVISKL